MLSQIGSATIIVSKEIINKKIPQIVEFFYVAIIHDAYSLYNLQFISFVHYVPIVMWL